MITIIEVAVGVALAPVVLCLGLTLLAAMHDAVCQLPYLWEDHSEWIINFCCIAMLCGGIAAAVMVAR